MNVTRLARLAVVGAVLALALPAVAPANEVTKWNAIALNTVIAQPPLSSSPNATAVFMAMTQGAVYGAVNAIDRHGRPYLVQPQLPDGVDGRRGRDGRVPCARHAPSLPARKR